jgi:maltooligosyltrehalose trehalohydrolase
MTRRFPIGAEPTAGGGTHFRVWAPKRKKVEVVIEGGGAAELSGGPDGYFAGLVEKSGAGVLYRYRLDGGDAFPDPASRFQPDGPHGPSQVIDPAQFAWSDSGWRGCPIDGQVIYEMHIGTFTREGTWDAARRELPELASAGITVVEVMPVSEFPGRFGWGYDGVCWFAPTHIYGSPDEFRRFIDDAHKAGLGVVLDVVYNHFGPDGNYLKQFADDYFTDRYANEWGEALNFDGENAGPVREFVTANAAYWAEEYHIDGLRLDATQQIFDASPENIMTALAKSFRAAAGERKTFVVAENESQHSDLARPVQQGGLGLDGLWNDDFHHTVRVAATGHCEAYYSDYRGRPQELISAAKYGYLFQGQRYTWQVKRRGSPVGGLRPAQFVTYIQNHDQVANSSRGERLHSLTGPGTLKALTAFLLLAPGTPLLFQGQEFAASSPFLYFADHSDSLRPLVKEGRFQFLSQFPSLAQPEVRAILDDPGDPGTFERCKLDLAERQTHAAIYQLHKDLLKLRREETVLRARIDGAVLSESAFLLRFFAEDGDDRLLVINLGLDWTPDPAPEPLLAPPQDRVWALQWSSEDPAYGGAGTAPFEIAANWRFPGRAAVLLRPEEPKGSWQI